jgi:hypothetical protein
MGVWARALATITLVLLAGCTGTVIQKQMDNYVGQHVSVLTAKLGLPTEDRIIAGQKVYIWSTTRIAQGDCQIRAILDNKDIIVSWDQAGGDRCGSLMIKLVNG